MRAVGVPSFGAIQFGRFRARPYQVMPDKVFLPVLGSNEDACRAPYSIEFWRKCGHNRYAHMLTGGVPRMREDASYWQTPSAALREVYAMRVEKMRSRGSPASKNGDHVRRLMEQISRQGEPSAL
jgi:hypothetical protein